MQNTYKRPIRKFEPWPHYEEYFGDFMEYVRRENPKLFLLLGKPEKFYVRFFDPPGGGIFFSAAVLPLTGCIGVNASFRPATREAFNEAYRRVEQMEYCGWPLQLEWRPIPADRSFHQVEMRCRADLNNRDLWTEQHRWLARHLWELFQTVGRGWDPIGQAPKTDA